LVERSKLSEHKFQKGKLITPFNQNFQELLKEDSWYYGRMPEYVWLGLIISNGDRNVQIEKCLRIMSCLHELELAEGKDVILPRMSLIFSLSAKNQTIFYNLLEELELIKSLGSLSLVFPNHSTEFIDVIKGYTSSIKNRIKKLNGILKELSDQHSNLTTDVRFIILYKYMLSGKLHVMDKSIFPEIVSRYPYISHEAPEMRLYRPNIRALEMGMSSSFGQENRTNLEFVEDFWKRLSLLTECEVFYVNTENTKDESIDLIRFKQHVYDVLNYYSKLFKETRPLDNRLLVLLGIATYSYKRLIELVDHNLEYTISGRSIMRSIIENYMMTKYLLVEEPNHEDIWGEYQDYGIGQYKLIYGRYADENPEIEGSHVPFKYINLLVSEFKNEEFIDIDTAILVQGISAPSLKKWMKKTYGSTIMTMIPYLNMDFGGR
jgi:hypothetical protein